MASRIVDEIREHGKFIDDKKKKVQCNYCDKEVSNFHRLKFHLAKIRGDVKPCEKVPENVRLAFKSKIENKKGTANQEVRNRKRSSHSDGNVSEVEGMRVVSPYNRRGLNLEASGSAPSENSASLLEAKYYMCMFLSEISTTFNAAKASSFSNMIDSIDRLSERDSSSYLYCHEHDLKGVLKYVEEVKRSLAETGCSILLDGWTSDDGRDLINIVLDNRKGALYLRSLDVTPGLESTDSLQGFLDQLIEEIGEEKVVQIVASSASAVMETLGKQMTEKHKKIFWSVSASHCLNLMLERIEALDLVRVILEKAKNITKLAYSDARILELIRSFTDSRDLVISSKSESATSFLTLQNIVSEEEKLKQLFISSEWVFSSWASTKEGRGVAALVISDRSFWHAARIIVKATIPIVDVMGSIYQCDKPVLVSYIYETICQTRRRIEEELKNEKDYLMPVLEIIDDVWKNKLHCPLHSAGYLLNPLLSDPRVSVSNSYILTGFHSCAVRMTQRERLKDLVTTQLEAYKKTFGWFGVGLTHIYVTSIFPDIWWNRYGWKCPELRRMAVRVSSQTCDGAMRYQLEHSFAEKLLKNKGKRNPIMQQRLEELVFVHFNMQLKNFQPFASMTGGNINPMNDWIVYNDEEARAA